MKTIFTAALVLLLLSMGSVTAQTIEGKLSVSGLYTDTRIKETIVADFYKAFRDGTYKINFSFKAQDVGKRGLVLFDLKTTIRHNGKVISETTRSGWPMLPGDLFIPVEAFDLIPALQSYTFIMPTPKLSPDQVDVPLPKGKYEVSLQVVGVQPKGLIPPSNFSFVVE